ncbi:hypothetical protein PbB2_00408 [Candidatus Phycosocius bacilliformis]|uniref:Uncharacterized protein n=1 Tax=Candidatus Phycosocius bacilliformis TaxID=1445552 RepID=A0A2P2E6Q5_9PROT|nr:hypothetical protein [Candidatus Phycosocius bacilliformis]GBF56751.1 hypothetical protein PbB2_00408 [Candidatus Phycosocius bacilliformis]
MSDKQSSERRTKSIKSFIAGILVFMVLGGITGYFAGSWLHTADQGEAGLRLDEIGWTTAISLFLGIILLAIYLVSAVLFGAAIINPRIAANSAMTGGLGDGPGSRRAYPMLLIFYVGYSAALAALMIIQVLPSLTQNMQGIYLGAVITGTAMMAWSGYRLWHILDEFFRAIWIEACALSCFISLPIGIILMATAKLGFTTSITAFDFFVWYQVIYLIAYSWVAGAKDPSMLSPLGMDDA